MTIQQLKYIIIIAEEGSLNKAAARLFIAQPSLSSALHEVEQETGITIFLRNGKGVVPTADGEEFLTYARQVCSQYEMLVDKYSHVGNVKKKFGVSSQHYSFATKAFVEMVRCFDMGKYEFAMRETKTKEVISDVSSFRSEIGILNLSDFNRPFIEKLLKTNDLEFHSLIKCSAYVYLRKGHPLASRSRISFSELSEYPCIAFEQGDASSFYFSEEILSTVEYPKLIKSNDRATNLNLMVGLDGYTLCPGIICEELNGNDYIAVPFAPDEEHPNSTMEIGYIMKKNVQPSRMGKLYIAELKKYLEVQQTGLE